MSPLPGYNEIMLRDIEQLKALATLIRTRNRVSAEISAIIGRPAQIGHVGEFIASRVFDIRLEESAVAKAIDGYFMAGPLEGRSVNIKWYAKRDNVLDITPDALPDFYLVLAGPKSSATSSRGRTRPWVIEAVYLFETVGLVRKLKERGVKLGVATSVRKEFWAAAEVYPEARNPLLPLTKNQRKAISHFHAP